MLLSVAIVGAGALVAYSIAGKPSKGGRVPSASRAGGDASGDRAKGPYGGADTTTRDCPAASVAGATARCVTTAECWGGIVSINGDVSINRTDCAIAHPYETFAIAPLPADAQTWNVHVLEAHPTVRRVCSADVLGRSRIGRAANLPLSEWSIEVIPPSRAEFGGQGLRTYRCVASITGKDTRGSVFRPGA